jgi:hypothetical protein
MGDRAQCNIVVIIVDFIHKFFFTCLGLENKQAIKGKVIVNSTLITIMPNGFLFSKVAMAIKESEASMRMSLMETSDPFILLNNSLLNITL